MLKTTNKNFIENLLKRSEEGNLGGSLNSVLFQEVCEFGIKESDNNAALRARIAELEAENRVAAKALELAYEYIGVDDCPACLDNPLVACSQCGDSAFEDCWKIHFINQARKAGVADEP